MGPVSHPAATTTERTSRASWRLLRGLVLIPCLLALLGCPIDWSKAGPDAGESEFGLDAGTSDAAGHDDASAQAAGDGSDGSLDAQVACTAEECGGSRCDNDNGGCAHQCSETNEGVTCSCDPGHSLAPNGRDCVPFTWSEPVRLEIRDEPAQTARVDVDAQGNAMAVWRFGEPNDRYAGTIWANRYVNGQGWLGATQVEHTAGASLPELATDGSGRVITVWERTEYSGSTRIVGANFDPSSGWTSPTIISVSSGQDIGRLPDVAVDATGNAMALWERGSGVGFAQYSPPAGWGSASEFATSSGATAVNPVVAFGPEGEAFAVWTERSPASDVAGTQYQPGTGWADAAPLNIGEEYVSESGATIATSVAGPVVAVWSQEHRGKYSLWARVHEDGGWSSPVVIEKDDSADIHRGSVAVDESGTALAAWRQGLDENEAPSLWFARYANGSWTSPQPMTPIGASGSTPALSMDGSGNAVAVWTGKGADGAGSDLYSARYSARSDTWSAPELVEHDNWGAVGSVGVGVDTAGHAVAIWTLAGSGLSDVWSARLEACDSGDTCPRSEPSVCVGEDLDSCKCAPGFEKNFAGTCVDIDECARNEDGCDADPDACVNREGGFYCRCPSTRPYLGSGVGPEGCVTSNDPWS